MQDALKLREDANIITYRLPSGTSAFFLWKDRSRVGFGEIDKEGKLLPLSVLYIPKEDYLRSQGLFAPEVVPANACDGCAPSPDLQAAPPPTFSSLVEALLSRYTGQQFKYVGELIGEIEKAAKQVINEKQSQIEKLHHVLKTNRDLQTQNHELRVANDERQIEIEKLQKELDQHKADSKALWEAGVYESKQPTVIRVLESTIEGLEARLKQALEDKDVWHKRSIDATYQLNEYKNMPFVPAHVVSVSFPDKRTAYSKLTKPGGSFLMPLPGVGVWKARPNVQLLNQIREALGAEDVQYIGVRQTYLREDAAVADAGNRVRPLPTKPEPEEDEEDEE